MAWHQLRIETGFAGALALAETGVPDPPPWLRALCAALLVATLAAALQGAPVLRAPRPPRPPRAATARLLE